MSISRTLVFCALLALPCSQAFAATPSLFFTHEEDVAIQQAVKDSPQTFAAHDKYLLTLQSIFYYRPDNWSVWMQDQQWTPATSHPSIRIKSVDTQRVILDVTLESGRVVNGISLCPLQSLNLLTGEISGQNHLRHE